MGQKQGFTTMFEEKRILYHKFLYVGVCDSGCCVLFLVLSGWWDAESAPPTLGEPRGARLGYFIPRRINSWTKGVEGRFYSL